jgi:hypothetical protein
MNIPVSDDSMSHMDRVVPDRSVESTAERSTPVHPTTLEPSAFGAPAVAPVAFDLPTVAPVAFDLPSTESFAFELPAFDPPAFDVSTFDWLVAPPLPARPPSPGMPPDQPEHRDASSASLRWHRITPPPSGRHRDVCAPETCERVTSAHIDWPTDKTQLFRSLRFT